MLLTDFLYMFLKISSLKFAAALRVARAEIFCCSTTSLSLHQPPGQGWGKPICVRYSGLPLRLGLSWWWWT